LGIGDWAQSPIPNPQSPIPNPQSPIPNKVYGLEKYYFIILLNNIFNEFKNNNYSWKVNSKSLFHKITIINL
jgi:hypothetical protein